MIDTDDSQEAFQEDLLYLHLLVNRIFRTAISQNLPLDDRDEYDAATAEVDAAVKELDSACADPDALPALPPAARDSHGRFVKHG